MCGIMGYVGPQEAGPILVDGLRRLEYRGYDSAGIAVTNGSINVRKAQGKITNLEHLLDDEPLSGSIGISTPPEQVNNVVGLHEDVVGTLRQDLGSTDHCCLVS